jgi:four helix bundle protein
MQNHNFRKLEIWKRSMQFVAQCYEITAGFPQEEKYGLTDQIRRAAVSVNLNIAEGSGSSSNVEFARFLQIARRSAYEVTAGLEIASNLGLLDEDELVNIQNESDQISAMISGLIKNLKSVV